MSIEQSVERPLTTIRRPFALHLSRMLRWIQLAVIIVVAAALLGRSSVAALDTTWLALHNVVRAWNWDLLGWEAAAILAKVDTVVRQPAQHLNPAERAEVVRAYQARAQQIAALEGEINARTATSGDAATGENARLQREIDRLRRQQHLYRQAVEQIIEGQVS